MTESKSPFTNLPKGAVRLLHLTDTHLFAEADATLYDVCTDRSLRDVLDLARANHWPPDAILVTGDLVHDDTREAYRRFVTHFRDLDAPVWCLAGNHDVANLLHSEITPSPIRVGGARRLGPWRVILLDTHVEGKTHGHLDDADLEWLAGELAAQPDSPTLVAMHHQPVPVGSKWMDTMRIDNANELFRVLSGHDQVRCLLWGHVHQDFEGEKDGRRLLATPSTCSQFLPGSDEFALDRPEPGYRWLVLMPDGSIRSEVIRVAHTARV